MPARLHASTPWLIASAVIQHDLRPGFNVGIIMDHRCAASNPSITGIIMSTRTRVGWPARLSKVAMTPFQQIQG